MTNGGIRWRDLSAIQRDVLVEIARIERAGEQPSGAAIRASLEAHGSEDVNHTTVYTNLDELAEDGLVDRRKIDGRTNAYRATGTARSLLEWHADRVARQLGQEVREPGAIVSNSPGGGLGVE